MIRFFHLLLLASLLALSSAAAPNVSRLPEVLGERLSDKKEASLPSLASGSPRLLLLAFSKSGGDKMRTVAYAIREDHPAERLPFVHVIGLASVPSLFRGMAKRSIRKDIPEENHGNVLVIAEDEQQTALREVFGADDEDAAYLVGVDANGGVLGVVRAPESADMAEVDALIERVL